LFDDAKIPQKIENTKLLTLFLTEHHCCESKNPVILLKNKSHPKVAFKWSSVDQGLLPALSGVVKTNVLTLQR